MRRLDQLITQTRNDTNNREFTDNAGVSDNDIIAYYNAGQERLYSLIQTQYPSIFQKEQIIDAVANQEAYELPEDVYNGTRLDTVEFSVTGNELDYYILFQGRLPERFHGNAGSPSFYIRRSENILIEPKPQSGGKLRLTFQKVIQGLDKRRAKVLSVSLDTVTKTITSLVFDPTLEIDDVNILDFGYFTVVDKDGVVQMRKISVDSIDTTTGIVTVTPGFVYEDGETISVGNWVCAGKFRSTNSVLPETCERYLIAYANWKVFKLDSNTDSQEQTTELTSLENDILEAFGNPAGDTNYIPIINDQWLYINDT